MPTRPYKQHFQRKYSKNNTEKNGSAPKESIPSSSHGKYTGTKELDRLLLHNSDDLTLRERHCLFPAFNVGQTPLDSIDELRLYPSCEISTPCPIYVANRQCKHIDICHRRTMARELFRKRVHTSRTRYLTAQRVKKLKSNDKERTYHSSLFVLAQRLECEPDPYFHGSYDYYYTGGNLCILGNGENVLHVDGENLNNLNIGVLPKFTRFANSFLLPISSLQLQDEDEVFEVRPIASIRENCANYFAVRQRNTITLHNLLPTGGMKALTRFKTTSTPFISFTQSPIEASTFLVTTMKQCVLLYDLNASTPILTVTQELCARDDATRVSWNMVRPWQGKTYLYANERKVHIIDIRTTPEQWLKNCGCGYKNNNNFECDFISSIAKSEFRDLAYVATNHKLHCLDLRFLGDDFETGAAAICHWTHQLEYAPAFVETFRNGANEFIALSSALADDMCICELTREHAARTVERGDVEAHNNSPDMARSTRKSVYKSYCLPYLPPTLENAYQQSRVAGKCLQPDADLKSRIKRCSTGLAFYDTGTFSECIGEDDCATFALLLMANSIGDLHAHRLIETDENYEETGTRSVNVSDENTMHDYAKRVCELTQPNLNYTEVVNLKGTRNVFRCNRLSKPLNFDEDDNIKADDITTKGRGLGRWRKSIQTLHSYKDALAQDLLSIWDIDYDPDDKNNKLYSHIKRELGMKPEPESLVSSWLDTNIKTVESPLLPQTIATNSALLDSSILTIVHTPFIDTNTTIEIENSFNNENNFLNPNITCTFGEFMTDGPTTQQQSTQALDAIMKMPNSPTEQEEFISIKAKPKPVKKTKYVKGF
ncbi:uncharacterized protein TAF1C-like [Eurosta solidaginis]|uniref:uncharacterized protein TAF1C-like n=1 Tax=Eurosta solidaginis TaxID=178769 RepID=UPI003530AA33